MLVWFIAGAMSMFWMAVMAGLILAEKAGDRSGNISRIMGVASGALGSIWLYSAWATPPM
jgi:predicted metal-binding membrane protein